jgi:hypothetical protein
MDPQQQLAKLWAKVAGVAVIATASSSASFSTGLKRSLSG